MIKVREFTFFIKNTYPPERLQSYKLVYLLLAAIISGASLTLSFAPFRFWIFSYLSLVSLIWLFNNINHTNQNKKSNIINSGYLGFAWGLGFFGTHVSWIFVSIYKYGGTNWCLAAFITLAFIAFLALFPGINLILLTKFRLNNIKNWRFLIAFPSSWVLIEIFRGWILTGFPWGLLGYTQLNSSLKYYASFFGVYGVSFIVAFIAVLIAKFSEISHLNLTLSTNKYKYTNWFLSKLLIILIILGFYIIASWIKNTNQQFVNNCISKNKTVAIVQGNIAPNDKFLFQDVPTLINRITEVYWQPTVELIDSKNQPAIDLVIWPENSLPLSIDYPEARDFLNHIDQFATKNNFGLLLGVPIEASNNYFYNSVLGLGKAHGVYHKINLVPFGDYVPLENWFRGIINFFDLPMSSFIKGHNNQPGITFKGNNILATVCYDIVYASQLRNRVLDGNPSVIVAVSEDGWFGDSLGPHQHLDIARMRAIEVGRYILRATTSGISGIIDNYGNIINQTPMFKKMNLISQYQDCFNQTIWNKIGNKPVIIFLISCLIVAIVSRRDV